MEESHLLHGSLRELVELAADIGSRKEQAAIPQRAVDDTAVDPHRLALSRDYRQAVELLEQTNRRAKMLSAQIRRDIANYDAMTD